MNDKELAEILINRKEGNNLLKVQVILSSVIVLMLTILIVTLAVIAVDVKPLISKVDSKMDSLEMPDFSSVNELVRRAEPLLEPLSELAEQLNDPVLKFYLKRVKNFLQRCDSIGCADIMIETFPAWGSYYVNGSCLN